jgi:membrane protease YdiL (CAAX protease family)
LLSPEPSAPAAEPPRRLGHPLPAWLVILALVVLAVWRQHEEPEAGGAQPARGGDLGERVLQLQGRFAVGMMEMVPQDRAKTYADLAKLDTGSAGQRLSFVALANELVGPDEALKKLLLLERHVHRQELTLSEAQAKVKRILAWLLRDYQKKRLDAPSVNADDRALLRQELGWFGDLVLAPASGPDSAARAEVLAEARFTFLLVIALILGFLLLGLVGFIGLLVFLALALAGRLRSGLDGPTGHGGVYAETFAVWMTLFLLGMAGAQFAPPGTRLAAAAAAQLFSLAALAWPVLRGIPWRQVRQDVGLTTGRQPLLEPFLGFASFAMTIPMMAVGVLVTYVLLLVFGTTGGGGGEGPMPPGGPSHPVVEVVLHAGWWVRLQVILVAAVFAPIVEETMFRGVLYRHLRDALGHFGTFVSIALSATLTSFVFAIIHPQGLLGVPMLMAIAFGLTLAREWRGTLVPGMVQHGLNNGLVMVLLISLGR